MKRFSGLMMASCLVLLTGTAFGAETIKIGVAGAHSGDLASYSIALSKTVGNDAVADMWG